MKNLELFKLTYVEALKRNFKKNPAHYAFPESELPHVIERMINAINKQTFNKDSPAFRETCKILGIKHTYKAIREFIETTTHECGAV